MLDQLEQAVITAEETRAKQKEVTLKVPDAASAPSGRPRTSLHPPADRPATAPVASAPAAASAEMPSFAAPIGLPEEAAAEPAWQGADPAQLQQMQAMQEQMAAMQAQLQQQALQQSPPSESPAPRSGPPRSAPAPAPAGSQQLSGYRRPEVRRLRHRPLPRRRNRSQAPTCPVTPAPRWRDPPTRPCSPTSSRPLPSARSPRRSRGWRPSRRRPRWSRPPPGPPMTVARSGRSRSASSRRRPPPRQPRPAGGGGAGGGRSRDARQGVLGTASGG